MNRRLSIAAITGLCFLASQALAHPAKPSATPISRGFVQAVYDESQDLPVDENGMPIKPAAPAIQSPKPAAPPEITPKFWDLVDRQYPDTFTDLLLEPLYRT
jgi:hypothetical protein